MTYPHVDPNDRVVVSKYEPSNVFLFTSHSVSEDDFKTDGNNFLFIENTVDNKDEFLEIKTHLETRQDGRFSLVICVAKKSVEDLVDAFGSLRRGQ